MSWKLLLKLALSYLESAGEAYVEQDTNDVGKDDLKGQALLAAARLVRAALGDDEKALRDALRKTA